MTEWLKCKCGGGQIECESDADGNNRKCPDCGRVGCYTKIYVCDNCDSEYDSEAEAMECCQPLPIDRI